MDTVDYILNYIKEWIENSLFIYPLLLSLLSAGIFYFIFSVIPQKRQQRHIRDHVVYLAERILHHMMFIVQDCVNEKISQFEIRSNNLTEKELKEAMTDVYMDQPLKQLRSNSKGLPMKVGEAVVGHIDDIKAHSEVLFRYIIHLDTELVSLVNEALQNIMNESFVNSHNSKPLKVGDNVLTAVRRDVSVYSNALFKYHRTYRKIEDWLFKKYPNHKSVLRRKYFHFFHDKEEFKKGIKISKKLRKFEEHHKEATLFLIKSYVAIDKLDKAKKLVAKNIDNGVIDDKDVDNSFEYDRKFKGFETKKIK